MSLSHIEHLCIQTPDLPATRDWYVDVLGLEEGPHPDFKFPVCWLYLHGTAVLHLTEGGASVSANRRRYLGQQSQAEYGSGVVDHIAFSATGLARTLSHLESRRIEFTRRMVSDDGPYQLFLMDPNGVKIELNFIADEAEGIEAELVASELPD